MWPLPAKAGPAGQRRFYGSTLCPLMERAKKGEIALLFMDASHFVMGCDFLGSIYGRARRFVMTFSGRKRYNVLGAMDFITKKVLTVANDSYITATEVCDILIKISEEYRGKTVHLVLDNARYQKCRVVQELVSGLDIHLEYIPPYSPNLNLIERLWKFVKGELRTKHYNDFSLFKERIDSIINSTTQENHAKISNLVREKVQLFDNLLPITKSTHEINKNVA